MTTIKIETDASGNVVMAFNGPDACGYFYSGGGGGGGGGPNNAAADAAGGGSVWGGGGGITKEPSKKDQDISEADLTAFLTDLAALTEKHGFEIGGCGCCGSPWIKKTEERKGKYTCCGTNELTWLCEKP